MMVVIGPAFNTAALWKQGSDHSVIAEKVMVVTALPINVQSAWYV
jgi:hypothetical protein